MNQQYKEYLLSSEWAEIKLDLIQSRGRFCENCGKSKPLNVLQIHHKTYERIFNELPSDLVILCPRCHMKQHRDIIPKETLAKFGLKKPKAKKPIVAKKKSKFKTKPPKKKKLTAYQKALAHFSKKKVKST